jgi:hypothetical protein
MGDLEPESTVVPGHPPLDSPETVAPKLVHQAGDARADVLRCRDLDDQPFGERRKRLEGSGAGRGP